MPPSAVALETGREQVGRMIGPSQRAGNEVIEAETLRGSTVDTLTTVS